MARHTSRTTKRRRAVAAFEQHEPLATDRPQVHSNRRSHQRHEQAANQRQRSATLSMVMSIASLSALVIATIIVIRYIPEQADETPATPEQRTPRIDISWRHPRVQKAVAWANALVADNDYELGLHSDLAAVADSLGLEVSADLAAVDPRRRRAAEQSILDALKASDSTAVFRDFEPTSGELDSQEMALTDSGTLTLEMAPRPDTALMRALAESGRQYDRRWNARVRLSFREIDDVIRITGWQALQIPSVPTRATPRERHPEIAKPETVKRVWEGEEVEVRESEPVPLSHLEDTPTELREQIDRLVADLLDIKSPGDTLNRRVVDLSRIGRPAIPRLLTKMYEIRPDSQENRIKLRRVIQVLQNMTGMRFGFAVADLGKDMDPEVRESALRQWYAWWYSNHDRDFASAVDKADDASLFDLDEDRPAAESASKKQ